MGSPEADPGVTQPAEYVKTARAHLKNGQLEQAHSILLQASALYLDHAVILSYCGWLQAVVDRKYQGGVSTCRKAFVVFKSSNPQWTILQFSYKLHSVASGRNQKCIRIKIRANMSNAEEK